MRTVWLISSLLLSEILGASASQAQNLTPCPGESQDTGSASTKCTSAVMLESGSFHAVPLIDGASQSYGDPDHNIISLYGVYGNSESASSNAAAQAHYQQGLTQAAKITPLCKDGNPPPQLDNIYYPNCTDDTLPVIIFLYIGFSNFTIEMGGGSQDAWGAYVHLPGQPCSTKCPNLNNAGDVPPWNQAHDGVKQESLLYQIYRPTVPLVGPNVVVWNGALESQVLNRWDPSPAGYYENHACPYVFPPRMDPECNYDRVERDLGSATGNGNTGGYTDAQVQAIFLKSADEYPLCDLNHLYCTAGVTLPDAYQMEEYLGDIVRYLKCCEVGNLTPRYPSLQQVFITSRIYGGYANGEKHGRAPRDYDCENPEPFAYEGGFAVQRIIVGQINQAAGIQSSDPYSGEVDYTVAPWFDWGPYLWASGEVPRAFDGLNWCNGQGDKLCGQDQFDVREGDTNQPQYWGDFTHPTAMGTFKVANLLLQFMNETTGSTWVTPWIGE